MGAPVLLHLDKQEGRRPGDEHQPRQGFEPCQVFERASGRDVAETDGGERGEREVHRIHEAAVEVARQATQ